MSIIKDEHGNWHDDADNPTSPDTAPLTAGVVAMVAQLREKAPIAGWWTVASNAADMLTALTAQLAERDAELARVANELAASRNEAAMNYVELTAAAARIAALTEALTFCELSDETPGGIIRCAARAAIATDKEPTT